MPRLFRKTSGRPSRTLAAAVAPEGAEELDGWAAACRRWAPVVILARFAAKLPGQLFAIIGTPRASGQQLAAGAPVGVAQAVSRAGAAAGSATTTQLNAGPPLHACAAAAAAAACLGRPAACRQQQRRLRVACLAAKRQMESPFAHGAQLGKPKLPLTWENVEAVLEELRPYLQNDGGDCQILEIEGPIVHLEMQGSCSSCSSSAITLKNGIETTLLDRIPEIFEVVAEMPGSETPTEEGVEKILSSIRPFLSVSGGTIELVELLTPNDDLPSITLGMTGPPQRNTSVKTEVIRRIRSMYAQALIEIVGDEE